ncbi:protein mono-ADP-ribosyltransferase PARP14-like [Pecten maximus]|uniref:protein mono-ADP-ribosyltransferase PARP14-like n=1 Tax=Pecten maximus TaxID=6579 RepID=UPI00145838C9|nr:protein mono-ADP-ribosyltransferase PARP14-like [Pecten maximus]
MWPPYYPYPYGQNFGPGYSGLPQPMTSHMSPYQIPPNRMPFQPQHRIYQSPCQTAPTVGGQGPLIYPDFPPSYPSVSTPENTQVVTMTTDMTRPIAGTDVSTDDSTTNNRCLSPQHAWQKQETETPHTENNSEGSHQLKKEDKTRQDMELMNPKTSLKSDEDEIKELQQWAQSPLSQGQIGQATSGDSTDKEEEHFYDTIESIDGLELGHERDPLNIGQIQLEIGNLADIKADVIVNPSNKDLNLAIGYVSKSILKAAGQKIQKECIDKYPLGINDEIVAITSAGNLASEKIFHVVLPKWTGGTKVLEELVTTCLSMAADLKKSSIAFPVLGTGKMGYPADLVAKAMFESVKKFLNRQQSRFSVYFVILNSDRVNRKAFESLGLESVYSEMEPMEVDEDYNTYTVLTKPHTDGEHLYDSLNSQQETQHNPSLDADESPYMDTRYINVPGRGTQASSRAKAASYMDMEEVRKMSDDHGPKLSDDHDPKLSDDHGPKLSDDHDPKLSDDHDPKLSDDHDLYVNMQGYKEPNKEIKTAPVRNLSPGVTGKDKETETVEVPQRTRKSLEDLPRIPDEPPQYIRVTYPQPLQEDTIRFYFLNKKKSGGGEFLKFEHHSMKRVTLIQFEDPDAVARVLHKNHKFEGTELQVTMVTGEMPPSIEEKKLLICDINPATTYDTLVNFLEVKAKAVPTDVMYGNRKDRAVVTFSSKPDFDMLQKICQTKTLEGNVLKVSHVPVSSVVLVKDCPDVSNDAIMLFFENEKKSGGGDVEKVEIMSQRSECLVHFADPAVAKRVCDPERKLEIEKKAVAASLYYPYLRSSEFNSSGSKSTETKDLSRKSSAEKRITRSLPDPPLHASMTLPKPITLPDIESNLTKFIINSEPNKSAFERMVLKVKGKVIWPEDLENDMIRITCMIDVTAENAAMEVEQWSAEIYRNVKKFFGPMTTEEVPVVRQAWTSVLSKLQSLNISYPDGVAVILKREDYTIVIAGHKKFVEDVKKKVEEITRTEENLREEAEQVSKSEVLKMYQIQILWKFKFKEEIKKIYPKLEVEVDVDNRKITFTGVLREVDQGRTDMRVKLEALQSYSLAISRGMKDLFFKLPAKTEFVQKLKQRHLVVVWDIPPHQDTCVMYAKTLENAKEAVSIFTEVLKEKKIPLKDDLQKIISTTKWQLALKNIFSRYPEEVQISVEESCVYVTAVSVVYGQVCGCIDAEISEYKKIHDTHKEFLSVEEGVFSFLEKHQRYEIETSTLALQKALNLIVKTRNSKVKPGYDLEGTRDAIDLAKKKLQCVIDKVSMDTHTMQAVGAADFFNSSDGQDKIRQIEHAVSSVIRKSAEYRGAQEVRGQSPNPVTKAKCTVGPGQQCIVVEGDMTKLKVDVMVNAANTDMILGGGIAGAILAAGGPTIQDECDEYVRKHGQVPEGKAIISRSGNLPCKRVVHAVGPVWQNGKNKEEGKLRCAIYRSLELATNHRSIALPAISAGIFGYPLAKSVEAIIEIVQHFFTKQPSTQIRSVYLCDTDHQTVKLFIKELVSIYSPQKVKTFDDTDSTSSAEEESFDEVTSDEESEDESYDVPRNSHRNTAVRVVRGELAKTKADVLVNSAGNNLVLNVGVLSSSLLKYGGQSLQTECTQRYPRGISPGDVAITTGGNLQCKNVYHGTFDSWGNDQDRCVQTLKKFVNTCLNTADKFNMTSIAFPALGAGRLGYPAATVAKVMLSCVRGFERAMPDSCLTTVMFVVYPQDKQSVQDFESAVDNDGFGPVGATGSSRTVSSSYGASSSLGPVDIEVKQGDITKETTDAIVNSTGDHLDLTRGAVSKAILKAGGQQLQVECNARSRDMQSRGLVVTSGGNLPCRKILHIRSCSRPTDLTRAVSNCLGEADNHRCSSLTFPALGTGQIGCPPNDVADAIFTAIQQYTGKLQYLQKVRIVIYQADMVDIFRAQLKRCLGGGANARTTRRPSSTKERGAYKSRGTKPKYKGHRSVTSYATPEKVKFLLWSNSLNNLQKAKNHLDRVCDTEFRKLKVPLSYQDIIKRLNKYQIGELNQLGSQRQVHLEINQAKGEITLQGQHSKTSVLLPEIQSLLHKFEKHKDEVEKAKTLADYVQWVYDDNGKWRQFNAEINLVIEKAYKAKDVQTKINDSSGVTYIIDFQKMEEYVKDSPHKRFKVERRDLGQHSTVGIRLPSTWSSMGKDGYQLVNLSSSDTEYKDTAKAFRASAGQSSGQQAGMHQFLMQGFLAPQYGSHQIIKIQRIQNKSLYQQYSAKKQELFTRNKKDPEKWLWHGTSPDTVKKIAMKGFDRSYCGKNATAYGSGVYFAVNASYSIGYCQADGSGQKHMFYTRVLTGESCPGHSGMKYLPDRKGAQGPFTFDSATNSTSAPSMYIIFHDSQAYPAYLISFK